MRRAVSVNSVEHAGAWVETIRRAAAPNVRLTEVAEGQAEAYVGSIGHLGLQFDVVVVDGEHRDACMRIVPGHLKSDGIIILDNADRTEYRDGILYLEQQGFRHVDFIGMGPINTYDWTTSIFYRSTNCVGL